MKVAGGKPRLAAHPPDHAPQGTAPRMERMRPAEVMGPAGARVRGAMLPVGALALPTGYLHPRLRHGKPLTLHAQTEKFRP